MNEIYKHHYTDIDKFLVFEYNEHNEIIRPIDDPEHYSPYQDWIKKNTPQKVAWDRFVFIIDGEVVVDPNKDQILSAEEADYQIQKKDKELREEIAALDWKILRYIGQEKLVAKGKIAKTKQTEAEFISLLEHQQSLRNQVSDPTIDVSINSGE
jgi:hypothetical protein